MIKILAAFGNRHVINETSVVPFQKPDSVLIKHVTDQTFF